MYDMSNVSTRRTQAHDQVIVRGFGGQPKVMLVGDRRGQLVEVISLDKNASICVPAADVFEYDERLFNRLRRAHRQGGAAGVLDTWSDATPWTR
jgi:hypothetical protein